KNASSDYSDYLLSSARQLLTITNEFPLSDLMESETSIFLKSGAKVPPLASLKLRPPNSTRGSPNSMPLLVSVTGTSFAVVEEGSAYTIPSSFIPLRPYHQAANPPCGETWRFSPGPGNGVI